MTEERAQLLQRISELERAANSDLRAPKRKWGEDANARERGTKIAKGGKGRKESGKGKEGKGTARAVHGPRRRRLRDYSINRS